LFGDDFREEENPSKFLSIPAQFKHSQDSIPNKTFKTQTQFNVWDDEFMRVLIYEILAQFALGLNQIRIVDFKSVSNSSPT
jgi:hypothetical protein